MPIRRALMLFTVFAAILGMAGLTYLLTNRSTSTSNSGSAAIVEGGQVYDGVEVIDPPRPLPNFTLTNQRGEAVSFNDLLGKLTLIEFGYTHCPDICPQTMLTYKQIMRELGEQAANVNYVFISTDGERDTPARLTEWLSSFDPAIIGLTGKPDEVMNIGEAYLLQSVANGFGANYTVDHTSTIYVVNAAGGLVARYAYLAPLDIILSDLRARLYA